MVGLGRNAVLLVVCLRMCRLLWLQKRTVACGVSVSYYLLWGCNRCYCTMGCRKRFCIGKTVMTADGIASLLPLVQ